MNIIWEKKRLHRGKIKFNGSKRIISCPKKGLDYTIYKKKDFSIDNMKYLIIDSELFSENSICFHLLFYKKHKRLPSLTAIFGILPNTPTKVPVKLLSVLSSQHLFPRRTEGRLKMVVFGHPLDIKDVERIQLQTFECHKKITLSFNDIYFSEDEVEVKLEKEQLIDDLGQWTKKTWDGKMKDREACNLHLRGLLNEADNFDFKFPFSNWDSYGGNTSIHFEKTGWFHTKHDGKRWWLVDPDGNAFISMGLDCIIPGEEGCLTYMESFIGTIQDDPKFKEAASDARYCGRPIRKFNYTIANLIEAFGDNWYESWMKITKMFLYKWGLNTIGNWADINFVKYAKMPYVLSINGYTTKGYPYTDTSIFRDFPDVFDSKFESTAEEFAAVLEQFKDDKYMIGYFIRNEPEWAFVYKLNIAEEMLANPALTFSKKEFIKTMENKYQDISRFNKAWKVKFNSFSDLENVIKEARKLSWKAKKDLVAFSKIMLRRYIEIPANALKKVDKNHLNLGMRYAYISDKSLLTGTECFDVFSINCYDITPLHYIKQIKKLNLPVMIGEFHHGALDKGLPATGLRAVRTQKDRGKGYRYYVEQTIKNRLAVGCHYFQYNDQSCIGRFDGENYQIGLIDVCMQEYTDMTNQLKSCHSVLYDVARSKTKAFNKKPKFIPPIHF